MPTNDELHTWAVRASQAWPLLTFAARHRHVFTYEELGEHLGLPTVAVGRALGPIFHYCESRELPLLNFIVVRKDTGKPEKFEEFSNHDIPSEQARVFRHKWYDENNHAAVVPSIEAFQEFAKSAAAMKP